MSPLPVISNRCPFAPPALPGLIAHMGTPDFRPSLPSSSLFRLVRECAIPSTPTAGSPWLPRNRNVRLDATSDPGASLNTRHNRVKDCCLLGEGTHRPIPTMPVSGLNVFRVSITCYLCTSPPFVPTHQSASYPTDCKARYQARG
jgi:hypothetical protein